MTDAAERLFDVRLGPSVPGAGWLLRVQRGDPWTDDERTRWLELLRDGFVHLAAVGGLCGRDGDPLAPAFGGDVEIWEDDGWIEWRLGWMSVDAASASLLLNLCDWATLEIAPALAVEVLAPGLRAGAEPPDRPLPGRATRLGFAVDEGEASGEGISIQVECAETLTGRHVGQMSHLVQPWLTAVFRGGFALPTLPVGDSEVRPADPPIVVVDDLYCWNFELFAARYEAVDVLLNCLERVHRTVCPIRRVTVE